MNLNELLIFVKQICEPEVSEQVLEICDDAAAVYVEPLCKIIAESCDTMHTELKKRGFSNDQAMEILVAMVGKRGGGK